MQEILSLIDVNVIIGTVISILLVYFFSYFKGKINVYDEVKVALSVAGIVFRTDKIKKITDIAINIVKAVEELDKSNADKKELAVQEASSKINKELNINVDSAILNTVIDIAVSHMPKTNK